MIQDIFTYFAIIFFSQIQGNISTAATTLKHKLIGLC